MSARRADIFSREGDAAFGGLPLGVKQPSALRATKGRDSLQALRVKHMKFTLHRLRQDPTEYWNGQQPLPDELAVQSASLPMAEFQLLALVCSLHGGISPYDILTGSEPDTEKDRDIVAVLTAFQWYVYPRMPRTAYSGNGKRS